jgi:4-diphosphocytidyl-2-C-methyl-D-erythritol kinase
MPADLVYRSYGKVNLYLDVRNRRPDGFHHIETIFQTVSLFDEIQVSEAARGIELTCSVPALETGEDNLIVRAARRLQEACGVNHGARIHLDKRIPIAGGMAGGSGNAAAALIALDTMWNLRLPEEKIREIAAHLGSDVPYCTLGGTAGATHRGEVLFPLPPLPETWLVLLHPKLEVSAARVYGHPLLPRKPAPPEGGRSTEFDAALNRLEVGDIAGVVYNAMEVPVFHDYPELALGLDRLIEVGCSAAAMSGSGPTLFGLCASRGQAEAIAAAIDGITASVVHTVPRGVERIR